MRLGCVKAGLTAGRRLQNGYLHIVGRFADGGRGSVRAPAHRAGENLLTLCGAGGLLRDHIFIRVAPLGQDGFLHLAAQGAGLSQKSRLLTGRVADGFTRPPLVLTAARAKAAKAKKHHRHKQTEDIPFHIREFLS